MRGKEFANDLIPAEVRITPAYAGKRSNFIPLLGNLQDHPRLCGEKPINWAGKFDNVGSPPPMRGKEADGETFEAVLRITPAYAGKSNNNMEIPSSIWDHPRLCGEKTFLSYVDKL